MSTQPSDMCRGDVPCSPEDTRRGEGLGGLLPSSLFPLSEGSWAERYRVGDARVGQGSGWDRTGGWAARRGTHTAGQGTGWDRTGGAGERTGTHGRMGGEARTDHYLRGAIA